jgi:NADH pyrophosphatase NudC (nudix superfamily)
MDIGSIFLILALAIPVIIYISRPLLEQSTVNGNNNVKGLSTLLAERDQLIASIQDLDEDYNLGKIPAELYPSRRNALLQEGASILQQIDEYQDSSSPFSHEARLEEAIGTPRQTLEMAGATNTRNNIAVPPVPDDDLEQRIAARRRTMNQRAGGFCPKCGKPVQASDRFCPRCGATLD